MPAGNSIHAVTAMNALHSASFQNTVIRGSIWDPSWGDDHTHPNAPMFSEVEWYLTCRQVAHAGDTFNTYCQSILADILEADASLWTLFPSKLFGKKRGETIEKLKLQGKNDSAVREALRVYVKVCWCNEIEIISKLRNKIVHQAGLDPEGEIAATIEEFPPGQMHIYPVALDTDDFPVEVSAKGQLIIDAKTGYWASQHVLNLIHIIDQTLCARYGLKLSLKPIKAQTFRTTGDRSMRTLLPGTPLPQPLASSNSQPSPPIKPQEFPPYEPMADPKEIACAKTWQKISSQIIKFIRKTCEEIGVTDTGMSLNLSGNVQSHTLAGHDRDLNFKLKPLDSIDDRVNELGVRLRQINFDPYVTIWSTKTQMMDYRPCELSEAVKAHLIKSIQQTISS